MANKELTAKVRLNTSDVESKLKRLNSLFNSLNKVANQSSNSKGLETQLNQSAVAAQRVTRALGEGDKAAQRLAKSAEQVKRAEYEAWWQAQLTKQEWQKSHPILTRLQGGWQKITANLQRANNSSSKFKTTYNQVQSKLTSIVDKVNNWASNQNSVTSNINKTNNGYKKTGSLLSTLSGKLRNLADTYLGVMGMKAVIETSDMITSAENKLNYVSAQQLGASGTNADGSYSQATFNATQDAMDKMYVSSQKVRMSYTDMMSNVSKSMALAGDAFDNNTDKAIRFQEIMAEAYAVGGASAQEMSSSMYQLIQALGSGTLAGDELRSVREGAPLAYQAIEEFAQGIYGCKDSLKDMASEGLITAEMVTAAIMDSGDKMDKAFAQTEQTFAQTWEQIKNVAIKAFAPVSKMLRTALNDMIDSGLVEKATVLFSGIAKGIMIAFTVIKNAITWIADNWDWLKYVIGAALIVITVLLIKMAAVAIWSAITSAAKWMWANKVLIIIAITIMLLIYVFDQFKKGVISGSQAIFYALLIVGAAILLIGILTGSVTLIVIGAIILIIAAIFKFLDVFCGVGWVILSFIGNLIQSIANIIAVLIAWVIGVIWTAVAFVINCVGVAVNVIATIVQWIIAFIVNLVNGCIRWIVAASLNCVSAIQNFGQSLFNSLSAIAENIGIAFQNAWIWAKNTFWEFIADVLEGISKLEPVINGIAGLLGKDGVDFGGLAGAARSHKSEYKSFVSVSDAWNSGKTHAYVDTSAAFNSGWNTMEFNSMGDAIKSGWNSADWYDWSGATNTASSLFGTGLSDWSITSAYNTGADFGNGLKDTINNKLSKYQNGKTIGDSLSSLFGGDGEGSILDSLGEKLGLDFGDLGSNFPSLTDPNNDVSKLLGDDGGVGDLGKLGKNVGDIADNTGSIADSMELADEDIEYLRKIAEMEWKKEYTTANITVDMTNNNTINGESDLDGIVTKLAEKLYEEMNVVANGVYAY